MRLLVEMDGPFDYLPSSERQNLEAKIGWWTALNGDAIAIRLDQIVESVEKVFRPAIQRHRSRNFCQPSPNLRKIIGPKPDALKFVARPQRAVFVSIDCASDYAGQADEMNFEGLIAQSAF